MILNPHDFIPIKSVVSTLVMALVVYVCSSYSDYPVCVVVWVIVGALVYVGTLLLMKDKFMKEMIFKIKKSILDLFKVLKLCLITLI